MKEQNPAYKKDEGTDMRYSDDGCDVR